MMRRITIVLLLLVAAVCPLQAVKPITSNYAIPFNENGCATISWSTDQACASCGARLDYHGVGGGEWDYNTANLNPSSSSSLFRNAWTCNLRSAISVYLRSWDSGHVNDSDVYLCANDCGGGACDSTDGPFADPPDAQHSFFCPVVGQPPIFNADDVPTNPALRPDPDPPVHTFDPSDPITTFAALAFDETNFNSQLSAGSVLKDANPANNYLLSGPCGGVIQPQDNSSPLDQWQFPNNNQALDNWLVIQPDCDPKLMMPVGVPWTPESKFHMVNFQFNDRDYWAFNGSTGVRPLFRNQTSQSSGFYFNGVMMSNPNREDMPTFHQTPTSYVAGSITVPSTTDFRLSTAGNASLLWVRMPGVAGLDGLCSVSAFTGTSVTCDGKSGSGVYAGGGDVVQTLSVDIESITAASPPVATLSDPFPFYEATLGTITAVAGGNTLTTTETVTQLGIGSTSTVKIRGLASGNGFYSLSSAAGNTIVLAGSPALADCPSACGTVVNARVVVVRGNSNSALNGTWYVDSVYGSNQVTLRNAADSGGNGVAGSGGYMVARMGAFENFIQAGNQDDGTSNIRRLVFRGVMDIQFPFSGSLGGLYGIGSQQATIDSWLHGTRWHTIDPLTGRNQGGFSTANLMYSGASFCDFQARRVMGIVDGWTMFKDTSFRACDVTMESYLASTPDRYIARINANSDGLSYGHQNSVEFKGCLRCELSGAIRGSNVSRSPSGMSMEFFATASAIGYTGNDQIYIHDHLFYDTATAIEIILASSGADQKFYPASVVKLDNILAVTDFMQYQPQPSEFCGFTAKCTSGGGDFARISRNGVLKMDRIFFLSRNSPNTSLLNNPLTVASQGLSIDRTFYISSNGNAGNCSTSGMCATGTRTYGTVTPPGGSGDSFLDNWLDLSGNGPTVSNLVISGGTTQSLFGDASFRLASELDSITILRDELAARAGNSGLTFTPVGLPGSGDNIDSAVERLATALDNRWGQIPGGPADGKTIDIDQLSDANYKIRNPSLVRLTDTSVRVTFTAPYANDPANLGCRWQVAEFTPGGTTPYMEDANPAFITDWATVPDGSQSRQFDITGLIQGQFYDLRLSCGAPLIHKQFRPGTL